MSNNFRIPNRSLRSSFLFSSQTSIPVMATLWSLLLCTTLIAAESTFSPARPPAIPLAVRSPYLSSELSQQSYHVPIRVLIDKKPGRLQVQVGAPMEATSLDSGHLSGSKFGFQQQCQQPQTNTLQVARPPAGPGLFALTI